MLKEFLRGMQELLNSRTQFLWHALLDAGAWKFDKNGLHPPTEPMSNGQGIILFMISNEESLIKRVNFFGMYMLLGPNCIYEFRIGLEAHRYRYGEVHKLAQAIY